MKKFNFKFTLVLYATLALISIVAYSYWFSYDEVIVVNNLPNELATEQQNTATGSEHILEDTTADKSLTQPEIVEVSTPETSPESNTSPKIEPVDTPPASNPTTPPIRTTPLTWGVFSGYSNNDLDAFEDMVGENVDMRAVFVNWRSPFPNSVAKHLSEDEKTLVIFWEQYDVTLDSIIAGDSDIYIETFAKSAEASGVRVLLAPLHEMNGNWYEWSGLAQGNSPEKIVGAWRRIVATFGNVPNVDFVWAVNNKSVPDTPENAIERYYPGDSYVDYVGVDGFNFGSPWQSFAQVFDESFRILKQYNKPIYILSMASAHSPQKAEWIRDAFSVELPKHPEVIGWVWFNENKERDWRVNSGPTTLQAFREILP